jgi:Beta-lactamase enzyme family
MLRVAAVLAAALTWSGTATVVEGPPDVAGAATVVRWPAEVERARPAAARPWRPDVPRAAAWADQRQGAISFAVRTDDRLVGRAMDRRYPSASVIKAMLMVTYLRQPGVRDRELRAGERALLQPMIRSSDNDAATTIRNTVGNDAIVRLARAAGMRRFTIHPAWGLSLITARDQTRFFLRIERLLPDRHRAYAMRLLRTIVPYQRWGMARVIPKGWRLHFKGGWGDRSGAVNHQVGLLRRGRHRIAVAVLTVGNPTHAYGSVTLEGVARRLFKGLGPRLRGTVGSARAFLRPRT